jgi:MFS transporter, NNP family, nitrate/nitrite transporter
VGAANAIVGGWGNLGGGVTQYMMTDLYEALVKGGFTSEQAWRASFLLPGALLLVVAVLTLALGQDTPVVRPHHGD